MFETSHHHHLSGSSSPNSHAASSRFPYARTSIDAFRSPFESPARSRQHSSAAPGDMSPHRRSSTSSSDSAPHFDSHSPKVSFQDHHAHHHLNQTHGHLNAPFLTIRKSSSGSTLSSHSGIHTPSRDYSLSAPHHDPWTFSSKTQPLDYHHHDNEDNIFRTDSPNSHPPTCDPETCHHHHHRRSSLSSTISIPCSDEGITTPPLDGFEIEAAIALEPMAPSMLVPLVERGEEMAELLLHPSNRAWVKLVVNALGKDSYERDCLPLWTQTRRADVPDRVWLKRSHDLLVRKWDARLWDEFCGMVGWSQAEDFGADEDEKSRRLSGGSGDMAAIKEEDDERS